MMESLERLTLVQAAEAIARGEVRSEALTEQALLRLASIGPELNCVVAIHADQAREAAKLADQQRSRGQALGLLHGVPLAHKDIFYRAGYLSEGGSKIRRGFMASETATVLKRLDSAGALDLGRLQMAEFALSPTGYNEHNGHVLNPWKLDHVPGGSSSGSGAAVASRLVYASLGTDTGGSIRHPAAMCGLTGVKPTWSRVSRAAAMALSWTLDCVGPLARTARDCARIMRVIAGQDANDPTSAQGPVPDYEAALVGDLRGVTIAVPRTYYFDHVSVEVASCLDQALRVLRSRGATLIDTKAPDMTLINSMMHVIMTTEAATIHRTWLKQRPQDYAPQVRQRIEPGFYYPATRYLEALSLRTNLTKEWLSVAMAGADLVFLPTLSIAVPSIKETTTGEPAEIAAKIGVITHCTRGINYLGLPSVSVPAGFVQDCPVGFQLVGRPFSEALILRAADAFQLDTNWHEAVPRIAS